MKSMKKVSQLIIDERMRKIEKEKLKELGYKKIEIKSLNERQIPLFTGICLFFIIFAYIKTSDHYAEEI